MKHHVIAATWNGTQRGWVGAAAGLIHQAFPEFYDAFSDESSVLDSAIAEQLLEPKSELGIARLLIVGADLAGISTYHSCREAGRRRLISLRHLLAIRGCRADAIDRAKAFQAGVEPVVGDGLYLCRIAIGAPFRGLGLSRVLGGAIVEEAKLGGHPRILAHVREGNLASLQLFDSLGFTRLQSGAYTHVAVVRHLR